MERIVIMRMIVACLLVAIFWAVVFLRPIRATTTQLVSPLSDRYLCNPTTSPSSSPSFEPTGTPSPSIIPSSLPVPTVTPVPQPTEAPPSVASTPSNPSGPQVCIGSEIKYAPTIIAVKRIDADSIWVKWSPVDQHIKNYLIEYSLGTEQAMWNTRVSNSLELTIHDLPAYRPIWVRAAGTDDCVVGQFGTWVDP